MTTAWITKYALTNGIQEAEGEVSSVSQRMFVVSRARAVTFDQCFHGEDWHTTREAAIARAEKMRLARIASLKKSLIAMEKLSFS